MKAQTVKAEAVKKDHPRAAPSVALHPVAVEPVRTEWPSEDIGMDLGSLPTDEVHDEADHAQWMQLRELAALQGRARIMNQPESHPDFDGKHCLDCDSEIPLKRLQLHRIRCVDCQSLLEAQRARASRG